MNHKKSRTKRLHDDIKTRINLGAVSTHKNEIIVF